MVDSSLIQPFALLICKEKSAAVIDHIPFLGNRASLSRADAAAVLGLSGASSDAGRDRAITRTSELLALEERSDLAPAVKHARRSLSSDPRRAIALLGPGRFLVTVAAVLFSYVEAVHALEMRRAFTEFPPEAIAEAAESWPIYLRSWTILAFVALVLPTALLWRASSPAHLRPLATTIVILALCLDVLGAVWIAFGSYLAQEFANTPAPGGGETFLWLLASAVATVLTLILTRSAEKKARGTA